MTLRFKTKFLGTVDDAEVEAKLRWLCDRLPMSKEQIVKRAIQKYYEHKHSRYHPSFRQVRANLLSDQKGECYYCHRYLTMKEGTIDHKIPLGRGGTNTMENLVMACLACNQLKSHMTEFEYHALVTKMETVLDEIKKEDVPLVLTTHATN